MSRMSSDFSNPYASPAADEIAETVETVAHLPRSPEVWLASILIWSTALGLATAAGYILLAWLGHTYPRLGIRLARADQIAQFATGAANAIVMAGLVAYGQYHAVIRRDSIWSRSIALLLMIASLTVAVGGVLLFAGSLTMWLLLLPAAIGIALSVIMFRWYSQLIAFRRQQRRLVKKKPVVTAS